MTTRKKANTAEREAMKRTQPKKVLLVDGLTGKSRMITVEKSIAEQEREVS